MRTSRKFNVRKQESAWDNGRWMGHWPAACDQIFVGQAADRERRAARAIGCHYPVEVRRSAVGLKSGRQLEHHVRGEARLYDLFQVASMVSSLLSQASTRGISCLNSTIRA